MTTQHLAKRSGVTGTLGLLLFAALALVNYIAARHLLVRWDLTRDKAFTVAPATRKVVSSLDDVVNVKLYFSKDLPDQGATIPQKVRDLLKELEAHSKGRLRIEEVDMSDEKKEQEASGLGIPKVPLMGLDKNKVQTVEAYLGIAILYADKKEIIPSVLDVTNLEYDVTSVILKLTQPRKKVGFLTGHDEKDPYGEAKTLGEQLRRQYEVETVDLGNGKAVPDGIATLIVAGPKRPIDERERYEIDQFLMRGGNALFLVDMFEVDPGQLMVRPLETGLVDQIARYGIRLKPAMVADWGVNEIVQMPLRPGMVSIVQYPLWPKIAPKYMLQSNPIVSQLPALVLPWTAPLEPVKEDPAYDVQELARTSELTTVEERLFSANPSMLQPPEDRSKTTQVTVIAAASGPLKSFFAGKPVPEPAPPADGQAPATPPASPSGERRDQSKGSQIVVVGSSDFAADSMLRQRSFVSNLVFLLNAVDWLTIGSDLIGIRSRQAGEPMLDPDRVEKWQRVVPWLNLIAVPGLVAVVGLVRRSARRRRRVVLA